GEEGFLQEGRDCRLSPYRRLGRIVRLSDRSRDQFLTGIPSKSGISRRSEIEMSRYYPPAHPIVGVLGGMGPAATIDLMPRAMEATPATDDADHIHLLVDQNPKVPSRIDALINGTGPSPLDELVRMAKGLESAGATMLAIPCNTAHGYAGD